MRAGNWAIANYLIEKADNSKDWYWLKVCLGINNDGLKEIKKSDCIICFSKAI